MSPGEGHGSYILFMGPICFLHSVLGMLLQKFILLHTHSEFLPDKLKEINLNITIQGVKIYYYLLLRFIYV